MCKSCNHPGSRPNYNPPYCPPKFYMPQFFFHQTPIASFNPPGLPAYKTPAAVNPHRRGQLPLIPPKHNINKTLPYLYNINYYPNNSMIRA